MSSCALPSHDIESSRLTIPARFCGPPGCGNGGYVAGRVAGHVAAAKVGRRRRGVSEAVRVTLRQPPPLETPMDLTVWDGAARAGFGGAVIVEAERCEFDGEPVEPVSPVTAFEAMAHFAGADGHPFPGCFVCGSARPAPDGMGLRPGRLADRPGTVATMWAPGPSVSHEGRVPVAMVWAALDCPGGWSTDIRGRPLVLGRMTALVDAVPQVGDICVVVGRLLGTSGRKTFTASTAYDPDGRILGRAEAVWFAVDPARFD